jgi:hypothetical protein
MEVTPVPQMEEALRYAEGNPQLQEALHRAERDPKLQQALRGAEGDQQLQHAILGAWLQSDRLDMERYGRPATTAEILREAQEEAIKADVEERVKTFMFKAGAVTTRITQLLLAGLLVAGLIWLAVHFWR